MSEPLLQNESALVTGAAQGIGQAIARAIEEEGGKVLAVDRNDFDLSLPGSALSLVETAIKKLKKISIFVHAASPPRKEEQNALAVTEAQWREMLEVNLNSGFLIARASKARRGSSTGSRSSASASPRTSRRWRWRSCPRNTALT